MRRVPRRVVACPGLEIGRDEGRKRYGRDGGQDKSHACGVGLEGWADWRFLSGSKFSRQPLIQITVQFQHFRCPTLYSGRPPS